MKSWPPHRDVPRAPELYRPRIGFSNLERPNFGVRTSSWQVRGSFVRRGVQHNASESGKITENGENLTFVKIFIPIYRKVVTSSS